MKSKNALRAKAPDTNPNRCAFPFADGRRCRMLRHHSHASLCLFHAREEQQLADLDRIGDELASLSGTFSTVSDINHVIARLFKLVARNRIPMRNAQLLAYLAQLLLYSQKGVKHEMGMVFNHDEFRRQVHAAYTAAALRSQPALKPAQAAVAARSGQTRQQSSPQKQEMVDANV